MPEQSGMGDFKIKKEYEEVYLSLGFGIDYNSCRWL